MLFLQQIGKAVIDNFNSELLTNNFYNNLLLTVSSRSLAYLPTRSHLKSFGYTIAVFFGLQVVHYGGLLQGGLPLRQPSSGSDVQVNSGCEAFYGVEMTASVVGFNLVMAITRLKINGGQQL